MLLLPRELWDEICIECLKNDFGYLFNHFKLGTSFRDLCEAHKYSPKDMQYCVNQFIKTYWVSIMNKAHTYDLITLWPVTKTMHPFLNVYQLDTQKFHSPLSILCLHEIVQFKLKTKLLREINELAVDLWVNEQPKEKGLLNKFANRVFVDQLEVLLQDEDGDLGIWIHTWRFWLHENICIPVELMMSVKLYLRAKHLLPRETSWSYKSYND